MRHLFAVLALVQFAAPALAQSEVRQMLRPDGSVISYSLDHPTGEAAGILVLAQGSGCLPTASNPNLDTIRGAFPGYLALRVEKYGIVPDAEISDGFTDCPPSFHAGHTVSQRVADYELVLTQLKGSGPIVLFGGSEGGLVVAMLAARIEPDAVIILSSATGIPFTEMVLSTVPPEGQATVKAGFAEAEADPDGTTLFAGSSHRFWADIMKHVTADYMLAASSPILVIQGGLDASSPVASARATLDRFAAARHCNLTYWEFSGLDHGMVDPRGSSHLAKIADAAARWVLDPQTC